jgi:hypothetical protein
MSGGHVGDPGTGEDLAGAGWLAIEGHNHMGVGLAVMDGMLPDVSVTFILKSQVTGQAWD